MRRLTCFEYAAYARDVPQRRRRCALIRPADEWRGRRRAQQPGDENLHESSLPNLQSHRRWDASVVARIVPRGVGKRRPATSKRERASGRLHPMGGGACVLGLARGGREIPSPSLGSSSAWARWTGQRALAPQCRCRGRRGARRRPRDAAASAPDCGRGRDSLRVSLRFGDALGDHRLSRFVQQIRVVHFYLHSHSVHRGTRSLPFLR